MIKALKILAASTLLMSTGAIAQDPPATPPANAPPANVSPAPAEKMETPKSSDTASPSSTLTLTEAEAKSWIGKTIYSSDNKNVGEIAAFERDASGQINELQADIGGFLGLGETRVRVMPSEFKLENDRVILSMTAEQAEKLPKVAGD